MSFRRQRAQINKWYTFERDPKMHKCGFRYFDNAAHVNIALKKWCVVVKKWREPDKLKLWKWNVNDTHPFRHVVKKRSEESIDSYNKCDFFCFHNSATYSAQRISYTHSFAVNFLITQCRRLQWICKHTELCTFWRVVFYDESLFNSDCVNGHVFIGKYLMSINFQVTLKNFTFTERYLLV